MGSDRLEAFSDGVMAIIITIMILALPQPEGINWHSLAPVWPHLGCYLLSFVFVGIYWNNHHHLMALVEHVNAGVLWLNLALLFVLSLLPYVTNWMGSTGFEPAPVMAYCGVSLACAAVFSALSKAIRHVDADNQALVGALDDSRKQFISLGGYLLATLGPMFGQVGAYVSVGIVAVVALLWFIPNKRVEETMAEAEEEEEGE